MKTTIAIILSLVSLLSPPLAVAAASGKQTKIIAAKASGGGGSSSETAGAADSTPTAGETAGGETANAAAESTDGAAIDSSAAQAGNESSPSESDASSDPASTSSSAKAGSSSNATASAGSTTAPKTNSYTQTLGRFREPHMDNKGKLLQGKIEMSKPSPFIPGKVETIPAETKVDLVVPAGVVLNSEISQKGDEIFVRISQDIKGGGKVLLPAQWYMRGLVTEAVSQKRLGRAGYVEVQFDKLVSPDGEYAVDFNAKLSTRDNKLTALTKIVAKDAAYTAVGAGAGAMLGLQVSGIPATIAMQGYNVAGAAALGATWGLIASLKRKGDIKNVYEGDELKITTSEPIKLPAFDPAQLPSAQAVKPLEGLEMKVQKYRFQKTPWGDKSAEYLIVDVEVRNKTSQPFYFSDLIAMSDKYQEYRQHISAAAKRKEIQVLPGRSGTGNVVFLAGTKKHKYSLIFLSRRTGKELSRVAIN